MHLPFPPPRTLWVSRPRCSRVVALTIKAIPAACYTNPESARGLAGHLGLCRNAFSEETQHRKILDLFPFPDNVVVLEKSV